MVARLANVVFQSAPPHGGRPPARGQFQFDLGVSIRAPARGATGAVSPRTAGTACFNPRPRTGGDSRFTAPGIVVAMFQSAPPHGGRRLRRGHSPCAGWFQSAPPHGGRPARVGAHAAPERVSIRAPARGATPTTTHRRLCNRFNPRPRTGGDLHGSLWSRRRQVSIRAPARGATRSRDRGSRVSTVSIRAPARGATDTGPPC